MSSPARRYYEKMQAKNLTRETEHCTPYQELLLLLKQDKQVLKSIDSIQDKQIAKREMLPRYVDWVAGVLEGASPLENDEIFVTVLLWRIDVGQLTEAVPLAMFAIEHDMQTIDDFKRSLPCLIYEQFGEQLNVDGDVEATELEKLTELALAKLDDGRHAVDMPDPVRAKFLKAAGLFYKRHENCIAAKPLLLAADGYDQRVGVKKILKNLVGLP